jgi:hypothetical protein
LKYFSFINVAARCLLRAVAHAALLRLSQREWFGRADRRQQSHESRLQRLKARMSHSAGGLTALSAIIAMTFLVSVKAHWPS